MSYTSDAQPIRLGYLFDFVLPDIYPEEMRRDLTLPFEMVFEEGLANGVIDRPVEIVFREVEGLPKGSVKAVIDAYGELVDEGCLAVFGPAITDNCVPTKEGHRGALPRAGDQRHRHRGLAGGVDVLAVDGVDDRRAHLLGAPLGQGRAPAGRGAVRTLGGRRELRRDLPRCGSPGGHPHRR